MALKLVLILGLIVFGDVIGIKSRNTTPALLGGRIQWHTSNVSDETGSYVSINIKTDPLPAKKIVEFLQKLKNNNVSLSGATPSPSSIGIGQGVGVNNVPTTQVPIWRRCANRSHTECMQTEVCKYSDWTGYSCKKCDEGIPGGHHQCGSSKVECCSNEVCVHSDFTGYSCRKCENNGHHQCSDSKVYCCANERCHHSDFSGYSCKKIDK